MDKGKLQESIVIDLEEKDILNVLQSSGRSRSIEDYPVLEVYLKNTGFHPFVKQFTDTTVCSHDLLVELNAFKTEIIFQKEEIDYKHDDTRVVYHFVKISDGYFLEISSVFNILDDFDQSLHEYLKKYSKFESYAFVSAVTLYCPPSTSSLYNSQLEKSIYDIIKKHRLKRNIAATSIGIICQDEGEFYLKDFYIKTDYKIIEGDLHYGKDFIQFHEKLLSRFKSDKKGLVLFHGEPGTGKTYYIRSLMKQLIDIDKFIIYLPPNMMDFISSPEMINYISQLVMDKQEDGKSCVILIEDAEPLISSRKFGNRSNGITNLLNITDGLLNDMISVQVVATFNTEITNIDEALLRPERLIARKEFKRLTIEDTKKLLSFLELDVNPTKGMTLAEIYSKQKHKEVLIHEYANIAPKIGYR